MHPPAHGDTDNPDRNVRTQKGDGTRTVAALLVCVLLATILVLPRLGERGLFSAGEVRCALIARAMAESGDWIQPRLNHVRYYEKPPLMFWAMATAYRWLGFDEFASRLPAALAYLATVVIVFFLGRELLGTAAALRAALVFATGPAAFHFGRFVSTDTVLTCFLTMTLLGLALVTRRDRSVDVSSRCPPRPPSGARHVGAALFWGGTALAGLTKGFVGLVFPLATAFCYACAFGGREFVRHLRPWAGVLILVGIFLPWHVVLAWRDPSFVSFYVLNEHLYRFLNVREPIDYVPLSVPAFWVAAAVWFFPWSLLWPGAVTWALRERRQMALPLIWAFCILGFFTLARSRLEYYAQPAYPALAILVAGYWPRIDPGRRRPLGPPIAAVVMTVLGLGAAWLAVFQPGVSGQLTALVSNLDGYYREYFLKHPDKGVFFAHDALALATPFAIAWLLIGVGTLWAVRARRAGAAFVLWVVCLAASAPGFDRGIQLIAEDRSQRAAARIVQEHWEEGSQLVVAGTYEDAGGITFYTGLPTHMLDAHDADLLFGYRKGDAGELFLTTDEFEGMWSGAARVFLLTNVERHVDHETLLLETPRHKLLTNRPLGSSPAGRGAYRPPAGRTVAGHERSAPRSDRERLPGHGV